MVKSNIHKYIAVFLIVIGILPFLGIGFGMLNSIVHALTIISGLIILITS